MQCKQYSMRVFAEIFGMKIPPQLNIQKLVDNDNNKVFREDYLMII